jgi:hypothetical protein
MTAVVQDKAQKRPTVEITGLQLEFTRGMDAPSRPRTAKNIAHTFTHAANLITLLWKQNQLLISKTLLVSEYRKVKLSLCLTN